MFALLNKLIKHFHNRLANIRQGLKNFQDENIFAYLASRKKYYKNRVVVQNKSNLLLKIILYNTLTLQQIKFNQMILYTKDN
jgi:hypothetical protein